MGHLIKLNVTVLLAVCAVVLMVAAACTPAAPGPAAKGPGEATAASQPTASKPAPTSPPTSPKPAADAPTATPPPAPKALIPVKMSAIAGSMVDAPMLIAQAKGYFQQEGLNVEFVPVASGSDVVASTSTGQLDVSGGGWSLAMANASLRGVNIKVVVDKQSKQPGFVSQRLSFRKDLYDNGQVKEVAQLKGRKVAVSSVASNSSTLAPTLKKAGLTLADLDLVPLPFPEMVAALSNKSVDAVALSEPFLSKAVADGLVVRGPDLLDLDPPPSCGIMYFSPQFAQNLQAGNAFTTAFLKGTRDYIDAFAKNKGKQDVVAILAKSTGIDAALFDKMDVPGMNPDGYVDRKALEWSVNYWVSNGDLKEAVDLNKLVDNSFVDNALKKLGKYAW